MTTSRKSLFFSKQNLYRAQAFYEKNGGKTNINTPINNINTQNISKDIQEIKLGRKIDNFAEDNGLTKAQARKLFEINPNATAETLKDPIYKSIVDTVARIDRVNNATPGAGRASTVAGKSFKEMTRDERIANFSKIIGS